jgi:hypothetical protein
MCAIAQLEHPRTETPEALKAVVQRDFAECIEQIALFPRGCDALKAHEGVIGTLDALVDKALSPEASLCAQGTLMQLTDRQPSPGPEVDQLHIMMSEWTLLSFCCLIGHRALASLVTETLGRVRTGYQWYQHQPQTIQLLLISVRLHALSNDDIVCDRDVQEVVKRIVAALQGRGYLVWFDRKRTPASVRYDSAHLTASGAPQLNA